MRILKFKLHGNTAFFKKPDVNSYLYFTYGNIHKAALMGIFGAIVGYGGYNQLDLKKRIDKNNKDVLPEFYIKLENFKIGIEPLNDEAVINKKVQVFNNSVGYASKEMGGNLIVKEQWLENPAWNIYLLIDSDEAIKISEYIINNKAVYQPYLGKNDHLANISEVELIDDCIKPLDIKKINSLCFKENISFTMPEIDPFLDAEVEEVFKYKEKLPYKLNKETSLYELKTFVYSNMDVLELNSEDVYKFKGKNIVFF
jgi:CRISPR-associated protein Cas5h